MSILRKGFRITGRLIKLAFTLIIILINVFILWRVFSSSDPASMKALSPNEALVSAYDADPTLSTMFRQEQRSVTSAEGNEGYFSITRATIIPQANQAQMVLRYNNSTIRALAEDYSLESVPSRTDELYELTLVVARDLTPENPDDNLSYENENVELVRVHGSCVASDQKNLYNYRKFVFDFGDLDLGALKERGELIAIYADVYYLGDVDYSHAAYGTLCIYDYITEEIPVKIGSADIKAIEEWKERNS